MFLTKKMLLQQGSAGLNVDDVFATTLYTGNSGTQTITTGIDLTDGGGLVWAKGRNNPNNHELADSARPGNALSTNTTSAQITGDITGFTSSGFQLGFNVGWANQFNVTHAAWSFRRAPKFFDIVTYIGNGVAGRQIAHDLGVKPGLIVVKSWDTAGFSWAVYHQSRGATKFLILNDTGAETTASSLWSDTEPTSTAFTVGSAGSITNSAGTNFVAYLFAHDTDPSGIIQCGQYTGNGSATGPVVNLGWEPQWLMIRYADAASNWVIHDNKRSVSNPRTSALYSNNTNSEGSSFAIDFNSTGFQAKQANSNPAGPVIYMAIRKGA